MTAHGPLDPFAGDPDDPAAELAHLDDEDDEAVPPLTPLDREDLVGDLADLDTYQALLDPRGVRGLVVDCTDCGEPHYFDWELLRTTLRNLLADGVSGVHEPPYDPDPTHYVSWDYARGFADGVLDAAEE
jgi:hypothetical protein